MSYVKKCLKCGQKFTSDKIYWLHIETCPGKSNKKRQPTKR